MGLPLYLSKLNLSLLSFLAFAVLALSSVAQQEPPGNPAEGLAKSDQASSKKLLTAKERLSAKWMDEQRVDNCKVPVDRRGSKPRPEGCEGQPPD